MYYFHDAHEASSFHVTLVSAERWAGVKSDVSVSSEKKYTLRKECEKKHTSCYTVKLKHSVYQLT